MGGRCGLPVPAFFEWPLVEGKKAEEADRGGGRPVLCGWATQCLERCSAHMYNADDRSYGCHEGNARPYAALSAKRTGTGVAEPGNDTEAGGRTAAYCVGGAF